jgi:ATP-binding cassette subfamily C (CFTR/MRP) protein 1
VSVAALFCVIERDNIDAGLAGLSLTYALSLTGILNWLVRQSSEVETQIVSVERVNEYTELAEEGPYRIDRSAIPTKWPHEGKVEFLDVELRYRAGLDPVLKGVSFAIQPREKVGIIGRTGAGKSSLIQALFRMVEAERGQIIIDGLNVKTVGLKDLRSNLAIIPQDPTLFTGTIRSNLDPFDQYDDQAIWRALEACYMKTAVEQMEQKLEGIVTENGENLSVGQRQLMCLGRALLRNARILVMDEATAAVDLETDALIQKTIREQFVDRTVLTIAHRLNTIIDNDKILVMDQGKVAEYDSPDALRQNTSSIFYSLLKESGMA